MNHMTITTEDGNRQNMFAVEPKMYIDPQTQKLMENNTYETHNQTAEKLNGRLAMIGVMAALLNYATTGQIIPGLW